MELFEILKETSSKGIKIAVDGERLIVKAPVGRMSAKLHAAIKEKKDDLLELVRPANKSRSGQREEQAVDSKPYYPKLTQVKEQEYYPLHHKQKGKYACFKVMDKCTNPLFNEEVSSLNIPWLVEVEDIGELELNEILKALIRKHSSLRTVFTTIDGQMRQRILPADDPRFAIERYDLSNWTDTEETARDLWDAACNHKFDFEKGPLFRCGFVKIAKSKYSIFMVVNHIVADGYSMEVLRKELIDMCENHSSRSIRNELPRIQSKDIFKWEMDVFAGHNGELRKEFWKEHMSGYNNFYALKEHYKEGAIYPESVSYRENLEEELDNNFLGLTTKEKEMFMGNYHRATSHSGLRYRYVVKGDLFRQLKRLSMEFDSSLHDTMLSSLYLLSYVLTGNTDLIVGYEGTYRSKIYFHDVVAWISGTSMLRLQLDPNASVHSTIMEVQAKSQQASDYNYPFDKILFNNDMSLDAIGAIHLNYLNYGGEFDELDDDSSFSEEGDHLPYFDIDFVMKECKDGLEIICGFKTDLFTEEKIKYIMTRYMEVLENMVAQDKSLLDFLIINNRSTINSRMSY